MEIITVEEMKKAFGIVLPLDIEKSLVDCMPREDMGEDYVLFPGYPLTIEQLKNKHSELFYQQNWYEKEDFYKNSNVHLRWYCIKKDIEKNLLNKTYNEQNKLLNDNKLEMLRSCEITYFVLLYKLVKSKSLFTNYWIRCSNIDFPKAGGRFVEAPLLIFFDDKLRFFAKDVVVAYGYYGSASAWFPQLDSRMLEFLVTFENCILSLKNIGK